ncbi:hypothetical protein [Segetibacter sp.]|uniref:hypothetical protein n=1 Tax=Segetibacter sp. TaxID=2231182 RepID=UPI00263669E0|nr:hypothetical protein [Segetibacter sp.]MCW3078725.1 hypothetical protein [Segetibacter sp.]
MREKVEYRKINCSLQWEPDLDFKLTSDGIKANPDFMERLNDYNGYFNIVLFDKINEAIGLDGWAVNFSQVSPLEPFFYASIYLDNKIHYDIVHNICVSNISKDIKIEYNYSGIMYNYIKPY